LCLQAMLMGARHLIDATSAGTPGIPTVIIMGDDTPSAPTTDTGLDDPEDDDQLDNFRFSVGELDADELAALAAANAGFLHPLHNSGDAWRVFSQRVYDSDGEDDEPPTYHNWTHPIATSPPDEEDAGSVRVHADVHIEKS